MAYYVSICKLLNVFICGVIKWDILKELFLIVQQNPDLSSGQL